MRHARRWPQKGSVTVIRSHHEHGQLQAKASTNAALQESKLMINAVPPADLRSGMVPGLGAKAVGHQGDGIPALAPLVLRPADTDYIHRYINGHGRQATSSDPDRRMRSHPGQW